MNKRTHEDSVVESELKRWGFWLGIQYAADGYSPLNTLAHILSGRGSRIEHRVLCVDPPRAFWDVNRNVLLLKREFYEVLVARYAIPCRYDTGEPYKAKELAEFLGIPLWQYVERLTLARRGYRRLIFPVETFHREYLLSA